MQTAARQIRKTSHRSGQLLAWTLRVIAAAVLIQTLFFKFTAAPESVYIFTKVHAEPWGRIVSGIIELVVSLLILFPRTTWLGALMGVGVMSGAIASHLTILGISVLGDGGLLFGLALVVFFCSSSLLAIYRRDIPLIGGQR